IMTLIAIFNFLIFFQYIRAFNIQNFIQLVQNKNTQWNVISNMFSTGPMDGFFDHDTAVSLYRNVQSQFNNIACPLESIGSTEENRTMYLTCLTLLNKRNGLNNQQGVFVNSLHHAREVMSLSMQLYTYAHILYQYFQGDQKTIEFLENNVIWFVPAVNVDGYEYLKQNLNDEDKKLYIRKNRKIEKQCEYDFLQGIDLNRNYPTAFGIDDIGSLPDQCHLNYRGQQPFSAKETQNIQKFLDQRINIKVAINLHSYGNMWLIPFNYINDKENNLLKQMEKYYLIY
ncbi:zinc carboxypeptidase family protein, putative, partial [Ichthyophthirius multifiliis]